MGRRAVATAAVAALTLFASSFVSSPARAEPPPTCLVLDVVSERGIEESVIKLLTELLLSEMAGLKQYTITGESDIGLMLAQEQKKMLMGCEDDSCIADIAGAYGAHYVLASSIGKLGSRYLLNVKLINTRTTAVEKRLTSKLAANEDELARGIEAAVAEIATVRPAAAAEPPAERPSEPAEPATEPTEGAPGESVAAEAAVEQTAATDEPAAGMSAAPWVVGGVAVVAGALGAVFGAMAQSNFNRVRFDPEYPTARSDAEGMAIAANVSFGVAAAAGIVAGILFIVELTGDDAPAGVAAAPTVSGEGAGVVFDVSF